MKKSIFILFIFTNRLYSQEKIQIPFNNDSFSCILNTKSLNNLVFIIAGSGPTDKDGNNTEYKNNSLKELSDSLSNNNISTLRFDKRGVGESFFKNLKEENTTIDTLVADILFIKKYIQIHYKFKKIYILGHSEGSLLGILALNKDTTFNGYISIAGAGLSADSIINSQMVNQNIEVRNKVKEYLKVLKKGNTIENVDIGYYALFRPSVQPYMISWIKYNPTFEISKIKKPILILQGKSDLQVDTSNAIMLNNNSINSKLVLFDNMNHIFKNVNSIEENMKSYNDISYRIHNKLTSTILEFINKNNY